VRLERADLMQMRLPLAAALLLAGVGIAALVFTEQKLAEARKLQKAGQDRLLAVRGRLAKVSEEEQEIRNNLVQFKQFTDKGMTGEEKRLEWIENLAAIRQRRRLYEVRYNLERQRPVDYPGIPPNQKGVDAIFLASRLKLELPLLHEGDLLNFLSDLAESSQSFPALRSCSIARIEGAAGGGGPLRPRLRADCVVDMITLKAADKPA
jgi:hypothetical protein